MDNFEIILSLRAVKDLDGFSDRICTKITTGMNVLKENPFPKGKLIRKIKGTNADFYRLRIDKYRVFYMIEGNEIVVLRVLSKKDVAKFIKKLN
ncbi:plasmid stabilization system protein [bacterium BMS3Bbin07]|nr:plasmid stabilization system protein [bacterium BMS3Bbin07]